MRLTFYGGAKSVTGANYLLEAGGKQPATRILVDCGLHQGGYYCDVKNFSPFPYTAAGVGAVFVTHAHIDHTGRLPKLIKDGFKGTVYATPPTRDFAELLLLDSEHILNKEAEREKCPPLYNDDDINRLMSQWVGIPYHHTAKEGPFNVSLYNAGHILGSSIVVVETE
ncbi:MAG: MBL fold metallo-hydrolase, partial [Parcubacteria group bacterium]|nr:MBL fold metallo-hydrolase [Parcubacteria group bacterium]